LNHLLERCCELAGLLWTDEARERLLQHLVWSKAQQLGDGIVGKQNLALKIRDKHGVWSVLDQTLCIGTRFVQLAHIAQDADGPDHSPIHIAQSRGVERGWDDLARGGARVEHDVPRDTATIGATGRSRLC